MLALNIQFTFLDMSRSATAGTLHHSALKFRLVKITTSAPQLEVQLCAVPVEQFSVQPVGEDTEAHDNVTDDFIPNHDAEANLTPTFADSMKLMPCPEVTCRLLTYRHA